MEIINISEYERAEILGLWERVSPDVGIRFSMTYGNALELLKVNIQREAVLALLPFWDPAYRVFTFADMDMVPTLEEYAEILGLQLFPRAPIYVKTARTTQHTQLARLLDITPALAWTRLENHEGNWGWSSAFLLEQLRKAKQGEKWGTFRAITALLVYGLVLFPSRTSLVSEHVVSLVEEMTTRIANPVLSILSETILSLNSCQQRKETAFQGSPTMLYIWLCSHLFPYQACSSSRRSSSNPIASFQTLEIPELSMNLWQEKLQSLNSSEVRWTAPWLRTRHFLDRSEGTQSVPLLGLRGCTFYHPLLVMRQFGFKQKVPALTAPEGRGRTDDNSREYLEWRAEIHKEWKAVGSLTGQPYGNDAEEGYAEWFENKRRTLERGKYPALGDEPARAAWDFEAEINDQKRRIEALKRDLAEAVALTQTREYQNQALRDQVAEALQQKTEAENRARRAEAQRQDSGSSAERKRKMECEHWNEKQSLQRRISAVNERYRQTRAQLAARNAEYDTLAREREESNKAWQRFATNQLREIREKNERIAQLEDQILIMAGQNEEVSSCSSAESDNRG